MAAQPAFALNALNPAQNSYGGLSRSTGKAVRQPAVDAAAHSTHTHSTAQANTSFASMEGYTLEGTKKTGASVKRRASVLEEVRKEAEAEAKPTKK